MFESTDVVAEVKPSDYVGKIITIRSNKHSLTVVSGKCMSITTGQRDGVITITSLTIEGLHNSFDISESATYGWLFSIESAIDDWTQEVVEN